MNKTEPLVVVIFIIASSLASIELKSQGFEGKIVYKTTVERPENSNIPEEQFKSMFQNVDSIAIFYLKNNRYKLVTLDATTKAPKTVNLFDPDSCKSYGYMEGQNEICLVVDAKAKIQTQQEISTDKNDTLEIIGSKCYSMTIDYGTISKTKIYFSDNYKVNVESIGNNPFGLLEYIFRAGALPLKIIMSGNGAVHDMVFTAIEVKEEPLEDKIFELPKFNQMIKSPF